MSGTLLRRTALGRGRHTPSARAEMLRRVLEAVLGGLVIAAVFVMAGCEPAMTSEKPKAAEPQTKLQCSACAPGPEGTWLVTDFEHTDYVKSDGEEIRTYTMDQSEVFSATDVVLTMADGKATARCIPECTTGGLLIGNESDLADYSVTMSGMIRVVLIQDGYRLWGKYEISEDGTIYFKLHSLYGDWVSSVTQIWGAPFSSN